jgi:hypothetical protein
MVGRTMLKPSLAAEGWALPLDRECGAEGLELLENKSKRVQFVSLASLVCRQREGQQWSC